MTKSIAREIMRGELETEYVQKQNTEFKVQRKRNKS